MPFTPFHWGPALLVGLLLLKFLDLPSLLISSVIPDLEHVLILVFPLHLSRHGFFHSYLGASILAVVAIMTVYASMDWLSKVMLMIGLRQNSSFKKILSTSILGAYSHIFLDSLLYDEMKPFFPLEDNPFIQIASSQLRYAAVYGFCGLSLIFALVLYAYIRRRDALWRDRTFLEG